MFDGRTASLDLGGTKRLRPLHSTLEMLRPQLRDFGITRIANVTGLDRLGLPVVMVCRPNSRSLAVSQGKGLSLEAAKCSGVMESIELFHGEHVDLPLRLATAERLRRAGPVAKIEALPTVRCSRFREDGELLWVEATDLASLEPRWVPYEVVHCSAKVPAPAGSGCFQSTSNGLASGNCIEEAMVHALAEVIERDATCLWELRSPIEKAGTKVDLKSIDDEEIQALIDRLERRDFTLDLFDTSSDIGVPSFLAEIGDLRADAGTPYRDFTGMGCHPLRAIAAIRAITEAAQCRLTLISGSRDDLFRDEYGAGLGRSYASQIDSCRASPRRFGDIPTFDGVSFEEDLAWMTGRLGERGLGEVLFIDLSRPATGFAVVRVVVPGLEGPDEEPDYVPGPRALAARRR